MLGGQNGFGHTHNPCTELPTFMLYSILRYDWNIGVQNGNVCAQICISRHVTRSRFTKHILVKYLPLPLFEVCEVLSRFCSTVAAFNLTIFVNSDFLITAWYLKTAMCVLL